MGIMWSKYFYSGVCAQERTTGLACTYVFEYCTCTITCTCTCTSTCECNSCWICERVWAALALAIACGTCARPSTPIIFVKQMCFLCQCGFIKKNAHLPCSAQVPCVECPLGRHASHSSTSKDTAMATAIVIAMRLRLRLHSSGSGCLQRLEPHGTHATVCTLLQFEWW